MTTSVTRNVLIVIFAVILGSLAIYATSAKVFGSQTVDKVAKLENHFQAFTFFTATTTTATSTNDGTQDPTGLGWDVKGAKRITFFFTHGGTATTSTTGSTFRVQVSPNNGTTWYDFNKLVGDDVSSTATSTVAITGATTTRMMSVKLLDDTFERIRVISTEFAGAAATDGEQTATAVALF